MAAKHSASPTSYRAFFHGLGHEDQFPMPGTSARYGFRKEKITGTRRNGRDAPLMAVRVITPLDPGGPPKPTLTAARHG